MAKRSRKSWRARAEETRTRLAEELAERFLELHPDPVPSTKTLHLIEEMVKQETRNSYHREVLPVAIWSIIFPGRDLPQEAYPQSLF